MNPIVQIAQDRKIRAIDVARATGFPASTIAEWLNGKYYPKADKLPKLAKALDVDVLDLIPREEN